MTRDSNILRILGAARIARRSSPDVALQSAVRKGLPFSALESVAQELDVSQIELTTVLRIPQRTVARRKEGKQLSAAESDRLYRVARTVAHADLVFGSELKARTWLKRPNRVLGNEIPLALLDTDIGARRVEEVLFRIAYGMYS